MWGFISKVIGKVYFELECALILLDLVDNFLNFLNSITNQITMSTVYTFYQNKCKLGLFLCFPS